jgi:hypothetical protein
MSPVTQTPAAQTHPTQTNAALAAVAAKEARS